MPESHLNSVRTLNQNFDDHSDTEQRFLESNTTLKHDSTQILYELSNESQIKFNQN